METKKPENSCETATAEGSAAAADGREGAIRKWIPEIVAMVDKLAQGDPSVRISVDSSDAMFCAFSEKLNQLAENFQGMVEESHEMAIGLCEHYDALNRIAAGDFAARAPEDSSNELIAKLGELINRSSAALFQTIEELQAKDRALVVANDTLRNIIEFLPDATFVIDREKRVIAWNKAMCEMTGVSKADMLGKGDFAYAVPFYGHARPILIDLLGEKTEEFSHHYRYVQRKGETLFAESYIPDFRGGAGSHIWITASPLLDSSGTRVGAIESVRDISDIRRVEEENFRLQEQLRQSQKMEAIGQLAGGIAHDFNNILTAIIGYGQLVMQKSADIPVCRRYAEQIISASLRAGKLTQDLLAFGRRQVLNSQSCDLNDIIVGMEEMLRRLIGEDVVIEVVPCAEALPVLADVGQIQQVLMNLVTNASDAMPAGGALTIQTRECASHPSGLSQHDQHDQHDGSQHYAELTVRDTGIGMDPALRQKIFEPFFTTKPVGKGTGLGLSMVFGIIAQHGGTIDVESTVGHGTAFAIRLPIDENCQSLPVADKPQAAVVYSTGEETILLIEDNEITREVITEVLSEAGYTVLSASDGLEGIDLYRKQQESIDMVILDVIMPHMNGREALDRIQEEGHPVRYLFMSGYTADIIHSKGRLDRELNFITKPLMIEELLSKVRRILDEPA